ncbi:MAG: hypothetical protein J5802_10820 [Butyrivibrio sp.]|nr:hypothetical protein [Butyrivibrio sp.]
MKKKFLVFVFLMAVVAANVGVIAVRSASENQNTGVEKSKVGLELLYEWQNQAFEVSSDYNHNLSYCDADELKLNCVAVNLCAYNNAQQDNQLTVDEVVDYFSEEYDSNGELKVYSKPEEIHDYIDWYYHGGSDCIKDFGEGFNDYLREKGNNGYSDLSYEETSAALKNYVNAEIAE